MKSKFDQSIIFVMCSQILYFIQVKPLIFLFSDFKFSKCPKIYFKRDKNTEEFIKNELKYDLNPEIFIKTNECAQ